MSDEMRDANSCDVDYYDWDGDARNGFGDYIPKICPREDDDHCKAHCPRKDPVRTEENDLDFDTGWDLTVVWYLMCHCCFEDMGQEEDHYDMVKSPSESTEGLQVKTND